MLGRESYRERERVSDRGGDRKDDHDLKITELKHNLKIDKKRA